MIDEKQSVYIHSDDAEQLLRRQWQPIDTAPKDGTMILTCSIRYYHPITGCWSTYHPNAEGKKCWRTSQIGGNKISATHWMPLPDPPDGE